MDLIKLELDNNIFRVPAASSFADLAAKLASKFGAEQVRSRCLCYRDEEGDFVALESELDWQAAMAGERKVDRFFLRCAQASAEGCENAIGQQVAASCANTLDALIETEGLEKVEGRLERGQLPCTLCFNRKNALDSTVVESSCLRCRGGKRKGAPLNKVWRSILLIVDARMKTLLYDSMVEFFNGREVSFKDHAKEEHPEKNSTNVSIMLQKNDAVDRSKVTDQKRHYHEFFNQSSLSSLKLTESHINPLVNSRCQADISSIEKSANAKGKGPGKHSFFGIQSARPENSKKWANSSFPDCLLSTKQESSEDQRFFSKEELKFSILEHEALVNKSGSIEVRMLVENRGERHWPENVRVRLVDCTVARDVSVGLQKRLRMQSTIGVKFCFPVKPETLNSGALESLSFEFVAVDEEKNVKYYSKAFAVPITGCKAPPRHLLNSLTC